MKTIIVGDIHAEWKHLNRLINKKSPDLVLQCGDFGWWPHFHNKTGLVTRRKIINGIPKRVSKKFNQFGIKNDQNGKLTKIFAALGNHENWDDLDCLGEEIIEIMDGVHLCPFGTLIELPSGETIMFCGGARSTDQDRRIQGLSWWPQEAITQAEMDRLPETNVDIIISHTAPRSWLEFTVKKNGWTDLFDSARFRDSSTFALELIFNKYKPKKWFSGHFHAPMQNTFDGCDWIGLDMPDNMGRWWTEL